MIRVKTMKAKNLMVIIVLSSVELVKTSQPSGNLDDEHKKLPSTKINYDSAYRLPDQNNMIIKLGPTKRYYLKPMNRHSDFDHDRDSYGREPVMENYIR
jgi:hypothetical protein